jgi:NAD(P)-dependent dehydrogenase (short-subunit alcohol dehydrogenase family)
MDRSPAGQRTGRTVLLTGATGGIGRATAFGLAAMDWHVVITGRDRGRAEAAAREIIGESCALPRRPKLHGAAGSACTAWVTAIRSNRRLPCPSRVRL